MEPTVASAAQTTPVLEEDSSDSMWKMASSSSCGDSHRANRPKYSGMYWAISA